MAMYSSYHSGSGGSGSLIANPIKILFILLPLIHLALAQSKAAAPSPAAETTTWAAVTYVLHGDRTPVLTSSFTEQSPVLTPLGSNQLFAQGQFLRSLYLSPSSPSKIRGLGANTMPVGQGKLLVTAIQEVYVVQSATATVQGLYPPVSMLGLGVANVSDSPTVGVVGVTVTGTGTGNDLGSELANGSTVQAPLGGYQYANMRTYGTSDIDYIWLSGSTRCPWYDSAMFDYLDTDDFMQSMTASQGIYDTLYPLLFSDVLGINDNNYINSFALWDYAQYQFTHNASLHAAIGDAPLTAYNSSKPSTVTAANDYLAILRYYASHFAAETNGNLTASGRHPNDKIQAIAGQTFGSQVLSLLSQNIKSEGSLVKLSLLFGDYDVFIAFAALAQIGAATGEQLDFMSIPQWGSIMTFELFSNNADLKGGMYPNNSDALWVRFKFRNGTSDEEALRSYPLFGRDLSQVNIPWDQFVDLMSNFVGSAGQWCETCSSMNLWCEAFEGLGGYLNSMPPGWDDDDDKKKKKLTPAVAGVVGGIVTASVAGIAVLLAALLGGFRVHRAGKTSGGMGGLGRIRAFKGGDRFRSDPDFTAGFGKTSKERIGSWEMGDKHSVANMERAPSYRKGDDGLSFVDGLKPAKVHEHI